MACLTALDSQTTSDFQILVADDGSPVPPPPAIGNFKRVHYLRNENAGYGLNCSRAAREALARGATHLLFLNNDTSFGPAFIETWIRRAAGAWKKHYLMATSTLIFIRTHYKGVRKPVCIALSFAHLAWTSILKLPDLPSPRLLWKALVRGFTV